MSTLLQKFIDEVNAAGPCTMLHMGSKRSNPDRSTFDVEKSWFGPRVEHVGTDIDWGDDVDVVCDAHDMAPEYFGYREFDFIVSCSVLEHCAEPWVVAEQMTRNLRPVGLAFVQTHFVFPLHGYPRDFFRFSRDAMEVLFSPKRGWCSVDTEYEFPCRIVPPPMVEVWNDAAESYLNVVALARRI